MLFICGGKPPDFSNSLFLAQQIETGIGRRVVCSNFLVGNENVNSYNQVVRDYQYPR